jgi:hypothetical protein
VKHLKFVSCRSALKAKIAAFGLLIVSAIKLWPIHATTQTKHSSIVEELYEAYSDRELLANMLVITGSCMLGSPQGPMKIHREAMGTHTPFNAVQFCLSIYAAADAQN